MIKFQFARITEEDGLVKIYPSKKIDSHLINYKNIEINNIKNEDYDYIIKGEKIYWSLPYFHTYSIHNFDLKETDPNFNTFVEEHHVSENDYVYKRKYLFFGKKIKTLSSSKPFQMKETEKVIIYGKAPYIVIEKEGDENE